jgi:hypothetical protein
MAFTASHVYRLTGDRLLELWSEVGLESSGSMRVSRQRLVEYLRADNMSHLDALNLVSSKAQYVSDKLMLRWSDPVVTAKFLRPNVVLLANTDTGVVGRRAHVNHLKPYIC